MSVTSELADLVAAEEDAARCYGQLAAWADYGCRHRTAKYFYKWACVHFKRIKPIAKLAVDLRQEVSYGALPSVSSQKAGGDMLQWMQAAYKMEQDLLKKFEKLATAARTGQQTTVVDFMADFTKDTTRQVAHLYRKVENLKEAGKDAAALQAFDHNLM